MFKIFQNITRERTFHDISWTIHAIIRHQSLRSGRVGTPLLRPYRMSQHWSHQAGNSMNLVKVVASVSEQLCLKLNDVVWCWGVVVHCCSTTSMRICFCGILRPRVLDCNLLSYFAQHCTTLYGLCILNMSLEWTQVAPLYVCSIFHHFLSIWGMSLCPAYILLGDT